MSRTKTKGTEIPFPFRLQESDSETHVSRSTLKRLAQLRGTTETAVIHFALSRLADEMLPRYEPDDGPLTPQQLARSLVQLPDLGETCSQLFDE